MGAGTKTKKIKIGGMTCISCQNKIQKKLKNTAGISAAEVDYNKGEALITYDKDILSFSDIETTIQRLGYDVLKGNESQGSGLERTAGLLAIIVALYLLIERLGLLNLLVPSQLAESNMGYGMLFVIGLITSVHCVAMCGGINLSQCIPKGNDPSEEKQSSALRPAFLYNLGRVISYTMVGFIVGALGSVVSFSITTQGILKWIAGIFMVIMGINMLGLFPWLRKWNPRMPQFFSRKINREKAKSKSPLYVGLLNGLMPCGPLQAMQIYALSTGNPLAGAFSMFLFSLGTVPLMFGFGALSTILSRKFTQKMMTAGAILVAVLGLAMLSQGFSLTGFDRFFPSSGGAAAYSEEKNTGPDTSGGENTGTVVSEDGVQLISSTLASRKYPSITVEAGTPVKWTIDAPKGSINGCNNRMFISEYGIEYAFQQGENIIEFTPEKTGKFSYSCWMGMIRGSITVVEAGAAESIQAPPVRDAAIPTEEIALGELFSQNENTYQTVTIQMTDKGFSPAVIVLQENIETEWIIENNSAATANFTLDVPYYDTVMELYSGENPLYLYPSDSFDFFNENGSLRGYVKVVPDIENIDMEAIKEEVKNLGNLSSQ